MSEEWKKNSAGDAGDDVQVPLGVGGGVEEPAPEYNESRIKVNGSTLALVASFAAALVVLYLLGLQNKPRAVNAQQDARSVEINRRIDDMLKNQKSGSELDKTLGETNKLISALRAYFGGLMKEPPDPREDPFVRESRAASAPVGTVQDLSYDDRKRILAIQEELNGLKLQMVMSGNPPAAMINNKLYTPGMKINLLTVFSIQADKVLMSDGKKNDYPLLLNSPKNIK